MATLLDIGLLKGLSGIFPLLLIFAIMYAILVKIEFFKEKELLAAIISIVLAFMGLFSPIVSKTIMLAAPYYVLLFVLAILSVLVYAAFGIKEETIISTITGDAYGSTFGIWMLALILIISIGSFASVISEETGFQKLPNGNQTIAVQQGGEQASFFAILTHPKVLGMALVLLVALFAIKYLTET